MNETTLGITQPSKNRVSFSFDSRLVIFVLLAVIAGMLFIWKPWEATGANARTVEVTGQTTIKAEPDEFVFYPSYEFKNASKDVALAAVTKKSDEIVAKLKALGVADSSIKTNTSGYENGVYFYNYDPTNKQNVYNLTVTITLNTRDQAQKVQDYLVTTSPGGAVSPQAQFSEDKRKTLESEARDKATKDARAKAEQSAKNLGFKIGKVKSVTDGAGFGGPISYLEAKGSDTAAPAPTHLTVQPGQNDLNYSVTVTYFLK